MIIVVLLVDTTKGVCVNNLSTRSIHAEIYNRGGGLFDRSFSKRVNVNSKECCNAGNSDCWAGTAADALYWIDCDTDAHKKGSGQAIVACSFCDIDVYNGGLIVVTKEDQKDRPIAVYACKQ